jgi:hypothetical protein
MEINSALIGVKSLIDLAKAALDARDDAKVKDALISMQDRLYEATSAALSAQEKVAALQDTATKLKDDLREIQAQVHEKERYPLAEVRPGAYAYAYHPVDDGKTEPAHYLCQNCYDAKIKSVLRRSTNDRILQCAHNSAHNITLREQDPSDYLPRGGNWM